jgi:uncharacterized protein (DUF111 family)
MSEKEKFTNLLINETTTIGIRIRETERICLEREISKIDTKFGEISIKIARFGEKIVNIKPEFEDLKKIARSKNLPLREIEAEVRQEIAKINSRSFEKTA